MWQSGWFSKIWSHIERIKNDLLFCKEESKKWIAYVVFKLAILGWGTKLSYTDNAIFLLIPERLESKHSDYWYEGCLYL